LTSLFERFPNIELADPAAETAWLKVPFPAFRGLEKLPVILEPAQTRGV